MTWSGYLSALLAMVVFEFGALEPLGAPRSRMPLLGLSGTIHPA
jgi:hypothetical protein